MQEQVADFVERFVRDVLPLEQKLDGMAAGDHQGRDEVERALHRRLSNRDDFTRIRAYFEARSELDAATRREAELIYQAFLRHQREPGIDHEIRAALARIDEAVAGFRAPCGDEILSRTGLLRTLGVSTGRERSHAAWRGLVALGETLAPCVLEVVSLRNRAARDLRFDDHFELDLAVRELAPRDVAPLIEAVLAGTAPAFARARKAIERAAAARFKTRPRELRPWMLRDPLRLLPPEIPDGAPETPVKGGLALARAALERTGLGLDDAILREAVVAPAAEPAVRNDPGSGYDELRRLAGMMRALAEPLFRRHVSATLPALLRRPAHPLLVVAFGELLADAVLEPTLLTSALKMSGQQAGRARPALAERRRRDLLLGARHTAALLRFQHALYRHPGQDLAQLFWKEQTDALGIAAEDPREPVWAAVPGIAAGPGPAGARLLGLLAAAQLRRALGPGPAPLFASEGAGARLAENLLRQGASRAWPAVIEDLSGEPLGTAAFVAQIGGRAR